MTERIVATADALQFIDELRAEHGPLMFLLSGGCCDGSVPNCYKLGEVIPGLAWQNAAGNVMGCYLHGLFEDAAVLRALFGARAPSLDDVFDRLVDTLAQACAPGVLDALIAP